MSSRASFLWVTASILALSVVVEGQNWTTGAASTENGFAATIPDRRGAYTNRRTITSDTRRFSDLFESPRVPFPAFYGPRPDNTDFSESLFVTDGVGSGSVLASTKFEQSVRSAVEKAAAESIDKVKAGESVVSEAEVLVTAIETALTSSLRATDGGLRLNRDADSSLQIQTMAGAASAGLSDAFAAANRGTVNLQARSGIGAASAVITELLSKSRSAGRLAGRTSVYRIPFTESSARAISISLSKALATIPVRYEVNSDAALQSVEYSTDPQIGETGSNTTPERVGSREFGASFASNAGGLDSVQRIPIATLDGFHEGPSGSFGSRNREERLSRYPSFSGILG